MAYQSDQSGRNEVYVQAFDGLSNGTKRRWMVSKGGGLPRWRSDSGELFYMTTDGRIMSVSIHLAADGGIEAGPAADALPDAAGSQDLESLRRGAGWPAFLCQHSAGMDQRGADYGGHQLDRKTQVI